MATPLELPTALWPHQKEAIQTIHSFLSDSKARGTAALLTLPTGTGKSGVIAWSLAQLPELDEHRLVLTPWAALRDQLISDIDERFWRRLRRGSRPKRMPPVRRLPPSKDIDSVQAEEPTIFVATIAAISTLANELGDDELIAAKFAAFDCVIVDEGHYEPAEQWSEAIRALALRTILLTATPYRNDLKFFTIGTHRYRFSHHDAERKRFLRKPEFRTIAMSDPAEFASNLRTIVAEEFDDDGTVRVIVRCEDAQTIRSLVAAIDGLGESVIGIHETFGQGDGDQLVKAVPQQIDTVDARFWVHQNKLIEGIDDPRFKVVAFFNSLRNGRAIVQQIGRILRNPTRNKQDMKALVVGRGDRDLVQVWNGYLSFDADVDAESAATMSDLVSKLVEGQPKAFYYDGGYRTQIDLNSPQAWQTFAYPLRTRVFRVREGQVLDLATVAEQTADAWEAIDRTVFPIQEPDRRTVVIPYLAADNSSLLRTVTFIEPTFGYTSIRISDDLVFVYDARGRIPETLLLGCNPLSSVELTRLFPDGTSGLTSVSLSNADVGRQAARRRTVTAAAIDDLAPDLADYGYVCTIAVGHIREGEIRARRYVGLRHSRLTDYRASEGDYESFSAWLDQVERDVRHGHTALTTFSRYAVPAGVPADPSPIHVLLDIDSTDYVRRDDKTETPLDLDDTALEIKDGDFHITVAGTAYPASLRWEAERRSYRLSSTLRAQRYVETAPDGRELIDAINEDQLLRVVPAETGVLYSHRQFIAPRALKAASRVLSLLTSIERLATISSEKGKAASNNDWDAESVFGLISALSPESSRAPEPALATYLDNPEVLFCTDLGTEIADFVALQGTRVALIHAKASPTPKPASASALHDVLSQAIKNLPYLQPFEEREPPMERWRNKWKAEDNGLIDRRRVGDKTPSEMWKQVRSVIANPQSDREVWIVMGQSLSIDRLNEELRRKNTAPEVVQIFALLQTAWASTSQMGARLRFFCSP